MQTQGFTLGSIGIALPGLGNLRQSSTQHAAGLGTLRRAKKRAQDEQAAA